MLVKYLGRRILWQRARDYLRRYHPLVIGVIGSTGKTMVKDAIALALKDARHIRFSSDSYHTRLGVALTILGINQSAVARHWWRLLTGSRLRELLGPDPDTIILELGARAPGEIDFFARQLPFTIGVVTNVHAQHLSLFTAKELLAHEYTSLIVDLPRDGVAILNTDDPLVSTMSQKSRAPVISYGTSDSATVRLTRWHRLMSHHLTCEVSIANQSYELNLRNIIASHQIPNLLAALAVAKALDVDLRQACQNLSGLKPPTGCLRLLEGINHSRILDDTYEATPESAIQALDLLNSLPRQRRIAVLGDIDELAADSRHYHETIGQHAARSADILIAVGESMKIAGAAALKFSPSSSGQPASIDVHHFNDSAEVGHWLTTFLRPGDLVLVKGSRAMRLERVVKCLLANPERDSQQILPIK